MITVTKQQGETGMALVLLTVSFFLIFTAIRMPLGTATLPGPGLMPLAIGTALAFTSLGLLVVTLTRRGAKPGAVQLGSRDILVASVGLLWVSLLFEHLGFFLCMGVFLLILSREFSRGGWFKPMLFALLWVSAAYWFFVHTLGVSLPRGLL